MEATSIIGIRLPSEVITDVDKLVIRGQAINRSDAIRMLIREALRNREAAA